MAGSFSRTARVFFNYEAIVPFILGSLALGVLSNAAFTALTNQFGTATSDLLLIGGGSLVILAAAVVFVRWWVGREAAAPLPPGKKSPAKHRGLILLVSRNEPVCRKAIDHHSGRLERVWLICSAETLTNANGLLAEYPALAADKPVVVNDVYDVTEVYEEVNKVYEHLPIGWRAGEVIADFTGMTAPASVGLVLACVSSDRPVQYVPGRYDTELKRPVPLDPIEVTFPSGVRANTGAKPAG